jgi:FHS family L-fucose permease-like MFS transporter
LGLAFLLVAVLLKFSSLKEHPETIVESAEDTVSSKISALQYPQLVMGMISIFFMLGLKFLLPVIYHLIWDLN